MEPQAMTDKQCPWVVIAYYSDGSGTPQVAAILWSEEEAKMYVDAVQEHGTYKSFKVFGRNDMTPGFGGYIGFEDCRT